MAETALHDYDGVLAYRKWLDHLVDGQRPDRRIPGTYTLAFGLDRVGSGIYRFRTTLPARP